MDRSHYLHVHLPGRGRVTLSLPAGIERAIVSGLLTADAEAWYEQLNLWVSISRHPAMVHLLSMVQLPSSPSASLPATQEPLDLELELPPIPEPPVRLAIDDSSLLPLMPLDASEEYHEFSQFLKRSSAAEERRESVRTSGPLRTSGPARIFVAGAAELAEVPGRLRRLVPSYLVPGWAATVALTLLSGLAVGLFFLGGAGRTELATPVTVTNELSAGGGGQPDSTVSLAALARPNPLAPEERELEYNLRIAEAVVWQPAIDFTPEFIWRSARKVDAVRNSISLYRIGAWRVIDSVSRDSNPLLEPYEEAVRVDEVLNLVQSAVTLLDSLISSFRISGDVLVFSDPATADRYSWLRHRADSVLRTPVAIDSLGLVRAPRRVVTRLLETLPSAVVQLP